MSYAIIRNAKYKRENLMAVYRHDERKNKHYSNKDIDRTKSHLNYSLKDPEFNYVKEFDKILKKYDLKGQIKTVSNIACEYMITSDNDFFKRIGEEETKRYFATAYKFVCEYKDLGEKYILSTKVHYEQTKEILKNIKLELPEVPDIKDIKKVMINRDEKICNEIIKPKDELIQELYQDNVSLHKELSKQAKVIEEAEKYQNERDKILADNEELYNTVKHLEKEYKKKSNNLDFDFNNRKDELEEEYKEKFFELEHKYHNKIHKLEKENNHLHKILDKFWDTLEKFISWICKKFDIAEEDNLVRDFQKETNTFINPEKHIKYEEREKEWDFEDSVK